MQCLYFVEMSFASTSDDKKQFLIAAQNGKLEKVIELSQACRNDEKLANEALKGACTFGHFNVIKWLVEHTTADVNYRGEYATPLTSACKHGDLEIVQYLVLTCHANINLQDCDGNTALMNACLLVNTAVSEYLLREVNEIDVNITNNYDDTALHYAVWRNKELDTKLDAACANGDAAEVDRLVLVCEYKINVQDNHGYTPLHLACYRGYKDIVETLMVAGADETITNDDMETPAQVAEKTGHNKLLKLLNRDSLQEVLKQKNSRLKKYTVGLLIIMALRLMSGATH